MILTITVPQGIGDIFWVYQKHESLCEKMRLAVAVTGHREIQERAIPWLKLLPKVEEAFTYKMDTDRVNSLFQQDWPIVKTIGMYGCNHQLEQGIRLEHIDGPTTWNIPVRTSENPVKHDKYVVFYVSQTASQPTKIHKWDLGEWAEFITKFRWGCDLPIVMIGAEYDQPAIDYLKDFCNADVYIDRDPDQVAAIIKGATCFLGYQSGMGILADNFGVPSLMVYFKHLRAMHNSWCQPHHIGRQFIPACFSEHPIDVAERVVDACNSKRWSL